MELQFSQYQHQSTLVLSTDKVSFVNIDPLGRRHEYTGGYPDEVSRRVSSRYLMYAGGFMSPMQRCFSYLVCQPLVTSYVIDSYLCLAMLHGWTLEYQATST